MGWKGRVAGVADSVWRLCRVAAGVVTRRSAERTARLLERAVAWPAGRTGSGNGKGPGGSRRGEGKAVPVRMGAEPGGGSEETGAADGNNAVHGFTGGVPGAAVPLQWARGHCGGEPDCRAEQEGDGRADRVFREHAGDAHEPVGTTWIWGVATAGEGGGVRSVCQPGPSV